MSDEIWKMLEEWGNSEEGKRLQRAIDITDEAMRIHEAAIRAMYPIFVITTNSTRPIKRARGGRCAE